MCFDESFSYFVPSLLGGEHTFKVGGGISFNQMPPRTTFSSGTFQFRGDAPYNPANPATYPVPVRRHRRARRIDYGYRRLLADRRHYFFVEDKFRVSEQR